MSRGEHLYAEQSVIGAVLLDNRAYHLAGELEAGDFTDYAHRDIYAAISQLITDGKAADVVSVGEALGDDRLIVYLGELARNTPSARNVATYATMVRNRSRKAETKRLLTTALEDLEASDLDEVVGRLMTGLQQTTARGSASKSFADVVDAGLESIDEARARTSEGVAVGVSTTLPKLDHYTGGYVGGRLYILAGRPGRYKSTLAWQTVIRAAKRGKPAGMISLEMGADELARKAFAAEYGVDYDVLSAGGQLAVDKFRRNYDPAIRDWPIHVDDRSKTLVAIRGRILEWKYRHDIALAIVDHVQLVSTSGRSRYEELGEISRVMKQTAMEIHTPIVLLSQLSREAEDREPRLNDLRESGNLEQDSDAVILLHAETGKGQENDRHRVILAKNRHGRARVSIDLHVEGAHGTVGELLST